MAIKVGAKAPSFTLATDGGGKISLKDFKGKKLVLYFYPKDNTPGCTTEACDFRDDFPKFKKLKAEIIGVSKDSVASHDKFKLKHELPFSLGSDSDGKVCAAYGVWQEKMLYGRKFMGIVRSTFLIDEAGILRGIWPKVKVKGHAEGVMKAIEAL